MPIGDVLRAVFARPDKNFYDDVLLVDEGGGFLGFIATETLFKVQLPGRIVGIRRPSDFHMPLDCRRTGTDQEDRVATAFVVTYPTTELPAPVVGSSEVVTPHPGSGFAPMPPTCPTP